MQINPDDFISGMSEDSENNTLTDFAKFIVVPEPIPSKIKHIFWGGLTPETVISRIDKSDMPRFSNLFEMAKLQHLMTIQNDTITHDYLLDMTNAKMRFLTELNRSVGGFERNALTTHTQIQQISTQGERIQKRGIFDAIKKRFGFGGNDKETAQ